MVCTPYKCPSTPLKKADNTLTISDVEKAEVFQTYLSNMFQPHVDILNPQHKIMLENI